MLSPDSADFGLRRVFRAAVVILGGQALLHLTTLAYNILMVRLLKPARVGELAVATAILEFVHILAGLGLGTGVVRYLSSSLDSGDLSTTRGVLRAGVWLTLAGATAGAAAVVIFGLHGVDRLYPAAGYPELRGIVVIFAASVVPVCVTRLYYHVYQSAHRPAYEQAVRVGEKVLQLLIVPATFLVFRSLTAVALALAAVSVATWAGARGLVGLLVSRRRLRAVPAVPFVRQLLTYSWPLTITASVQVLMQHADILCLGYLKSRELAGLYRPAAALALLMWIVPQALTYLLFPVANQLLDRGRSRDLGTLQRRAFKYLVLINLAPLAAFVALAPEVLRLLYGAEFVPGAAALPLLAGAVYLKGLFAPCQHVLAAWKRTRLELVLNLVAFAVNVALNLVLIPPLGLVGAALATFASLAVMAAVEFLFARRVAGFWSLDGRAGLIALGAGAVLAAAAGLAPHALVRGAAGFAAVAAAWMVLFVVDGAERAALRGGLHEARTRGLAEALRALFNPRR